jgi:hypothetical protein
MEAVVSEGRRADLEQASLGYQRFDARDVGQEVNRRPIDRRRVASTAFSQSDRS